MNRWDDIYQPLMGKKISRLGFMPLSNSDTPNVVEDLREPKVYFSGSVRFTFHEADDVYLTWKQQTGTGDFHLIPSLQNDWSEESLDLIWAPWDGVWEDIPGAQLIGLSLYQTIGVDTVEPTAVRHQLRTATGDSEVWVCNASDRFLAPGDDLAVCRSVDDKAEGLLLTRQIVGVPT